MISMIILKVYKNGNEIYKFRENNNRNHRTDRLTELKRKI
jgi:hypothetical protein